jgi:molybdenum cofactor cytidylyltransferase
VNACGLILAAGAGSRYGSSPKLLAELDGRPLLEHAIAAQCGVPALERVVVVLGAHAQEILDTVDLMRADPVVCPNWREGVSASLRCGAGALAGAERVIVTLGDEPLMTSELIARFLPAPPGARATYAGQPGHPVVLGPEQLGAIRGLRGDRGAQELLHAGARIECGRLGAVADVDTPEDLMALRSGTPAISRAWPRRTTARAASPSPARFQGNRDSR